ncbi:MAG: hypothetical protein AAF611_01315 [Bacteroidota bacterium]
MKFSQIVLPLLLIANIYFVKAQQANDTKAPKTNFVVTINGRDYKVSEGEKIQKDGNTISVKVSEFKTFDNGSISYEYPTHFGFEYESSFGYKNWTFDGNNFVIMNFEIVAGTLDLFVDEIVGRFGKSNCTIKRTSMKLGSRTLKGKRINVELMGEKLTLDMLEIKMGDGKTRIIAFQDSLNEYGTPTEEGEKAIDKINETITYKKE